LKYQIEKLYSSIEDAQVNLIYPQSGGK